MTHQAPAGQPTSENAEQLSHNSPARGVGDDGRGAEAMQHPLTLAFLFLCGLAIIHFIGISPFPISKSWGAILLLIAATATAGSFYWAYAIRYRPSQLSQPRYDENLQAEAPGPENLIQLRAFLEEEFVALGWEAGLKSLAELEHEYEQLQAVLDTGESPGGLSASYIPRLAEETYRQGLKVLSNVRDLMQAIHASNRNKLEEEIAELESEIKELRNNPVPPERVRYKKETINSHRERLSLLDQQQLRVDELLYQAELCEASLARAHIELATLHTGDSESSVSTVTHALQSTIDRAREVQEELRQLGL
jgi:hypothetical protein